MRKISSIEIAIIFIISSLITMMITPPFTYLIISWIAATCSLIMLLLTSKRFLHFKKCLFIISLLLACYLTGISEINPLNVRFQSSQFNCVSVAKILQHFAKQRVGKSNWSFILVGDELCTKKISISVPNGATFEEVLNTISNVTNSDYNWHRYRICGNDPGSGSIRFQLTQRHGDKSKQLLVFRSEIIEPPKN